MCNMIARLLPHASAVNYRVWIDLGSLLFICALPLALKLEVAVALQARGLSSLVSFDSATTGVGCR